jgi:hypothetical protein
MRDLEETFRTGLAELAEEAEASPQVVRRVVDRARSRRGRRAGLLALGASAAAVVVVAGAAVVVQQSRDDRQQVGPSAPSSSFDGTAPSAPAGYRLELWHDVGVYVPATWAWGAAPVKDAAGRAVLCGGTQVVQADGSRHVAPTQSYVGRPAQPSGSCTSGWARQRPEASYVWLGGDVPVGTVDLGGGWTRETVAVGDVTVSVASDDDALRTAILASAHPVAGACDARIGNPPTPGGSTEPGFVPDAMTVCAYAPTSDGLDYDLLDEQELSAGPAKALMAAVEDAKPLGSSSCYNASGGEWALLRLSEVGGSFRDYVVDMYCPSIADPTGDQHALNGETVRPWAVGGINTVLHGSPLADTPDRFIPPLP